MHVFNFRFSVVLLSVSSELLMWSQALNIVVIFLLSLREVQRLKLAFTFACFKCFMHFLTSLERFLTEI